MDPDSLQIRINNRISTLQKLLFQTLEQDPDVYLKAEAALVRMVKKLKEREISLILYTPPCYVDFNKKILRKEWEKQLKFIGRVCSQYRIPYIDQMDAPKLVHDKSIFLDPDHLNTKGAKKFTRLLMNELGLY